MLESATRLALLTLSFGLLAAPAWAAEPNIRDLNVRGLQVGGTTTLLVEGDDLGPATKLLLPFPAKQTLKPGSTDKQATFEVALDDAVPPGYHHLRVVTDGGVSLPVIIGVDRLPQRTITTSPEPLPVALHGTVNGSTTIETTFAGKTGQKLIAEVEAQRLGSKLRPVVHLYGPKRLQVTWAWGAPALLGDTRLQAALPEDGLYTIAVHDAEYATPGPGFFRLKIGQWSFVDQVFPPVIGRGARAVELLGASSVRMDLSAAQSLGPVPLSWPKDGTWSGPRPFVDVGTRTEVLEQPASGTIQDLPTGSVAVNGRLLSPFVEDRYRVSVTPGTKVRFELFAERLGSPVDAALIVRNDAGGELARAEDGPGTLDPVLEYAVPDKMTSVVIAVVDSQGRGGPRGVYHLTVDPVTPTGGPADFRLFTPAGRVLLAKNERSVVPVLVERRGYQGRIDLTADGMPPGVKLSGLTIPTGADGTLVTIEPGASTAGATISTWRGRGTSGPERPVQLKGHPLERLQPWLATELAVAPVVTKAVGFSIDWRGASDLAMFPGGKLTLPVSVKRSPADSVVRLTLVTSQLPPLVNNQPDVNRTIRPEKPVELAAKVTDGAVVVLVPPKLPGPVYDVAIQAELLAADKKTVLATAVTPVRRLAVRKLPFLVLWQ